MIEPGNGAGENNSDTSSTTIDRPPSTTNPIGTVALVCVALFMLMLDMTIVATALPDIQSTFDGTLADLQWVIDAYTLPIASLLLTAATFGDRVGRRRLFLAGMTLFTVASLACALSPTMLSLNIFRAVQGAGAVLLFGVALPLVAATMPEGRARSRAIGVVGAVMATASVMGPLVGGALVETLGWQWIFLVNVPIGIAAVVIATRVIGESRDEQAQQPDWPGTALLTTGLFTGVLVLVQGNAWGWSSLRVLGAAAVAVALLAGFLVWESMCPNPLLDLGLLLRPAFTGLLLAAAASGAGLIAVSTFLALYFMNTLGYSPLEAGLRVLPLSAAGLIAAPLAAVTYTSARMRFSIPLGLGAMGVGLWLCTGVEPHDDWRHFVPGMVLAGLGLGAVTAIAAQGSLESAEGHRTGMATGAVNSARQLGIAVGIAALGALLHNRSAIRAEDLLAQQPLTRNMSGARADELIDALGSGVGLRVLEFVPEQLSFAKPMLTQIATTVSAYGMDTVLFAAAVGTLATAVVVAALLRIDSRYR